MAQTTTQGGIPPAGLPPDQTGTPPLNDSNQSLPNQPKGFPIPQRRGPLPPPDAGDSGDPYLRIVHPANWSSKNGHIVAVGGVEMLYRGYQLFADRIDGDTHTNVFVATGNVRLFGKDETVVGESIEVDFNNKTFVATDATSVVHPSAIGPDAKADVFLKGSRTYGNKRRVFGEHTAFTTCDKEKPHFELVAERTDYRNGTRVILHKVRVKLFGRTLVTLPYLSIPLNHPNFKYLPEVGYTDQLGYYIKSRFGIYDHNQNHMDGRLEYYTKLGLGLGADYTYRNKNDGGYATFFTVDGPHPLLEFNQDHKMRLGRSTLDIQNSYQKTNYTDATNNTILNTRVALVIPQGKSNSSVTMFRNSNETSTYSTLNESLGFSDSRYFNSKFHTNLDLTYVNNRSTFSSSSPVQREEFDIRFRATEDLNKANLDFTYQRNIPIGTVANFFSASDLTPMVALTTTSQKLLGADSHFYLPFTAEVSLGQFSDPVSHGYLSRTDYNVRFSHNDPFTKRLRFDLNGKFDQGMYSDGTAQYTLNFMPTLSYRLGARTQANLRYAYLRPYGFTPLQIDRTGQTNLFTGDVTFQPHKYFLFAAQTGYDLLLLQQHQKTAYQQFSLRGEFQPRPFFSFRALSTYDPIIGSWSNIRFDLAYKPGSTFVSLGSRYDGVRKSWAAVNLFVDGLKWGRLKTSTILNYNGYLKKFEARHFQFTYDLHCAEAVLTVLDNPIGFQSGRQVTLFVRLKAFPMNSSFGTGTRGQPYGTGTGVGG